MFGIVFLLLSCIPREDPPDRITLDYLRTLPDTLFENSGMIGSENMIWFITDGGNKPELYAYSYDQDTVIRTVVVKDAVNTDWEDITRNEDFVYIGDFGNNLGNRTDLRIYILNRSALLTEADTVMPSGLINFSYSDQTDFSYENESTPYDCEAFIATGDSIYLFTKDWSTHETSIYVIPARPGTHIARFRAQWQGISGLVTSAAWSPATQDLYLLGYTPLIPLVVKFTGFTPEELTFTDATRYDFADFWGAQTEALMISDNGLVYISSERSSVSNAGLFRIED